MINAEVVLTCDNCGADENFELKVDQTPEDMVDDEGWSRVGILLDKLLCPDCAEDEAILNEFEKV